MNKNKGIFILSGVLLFALFLFIMAFYVAWVLLPVVLILILFGFVGNAAVYLYRRYFMKKNIPDIEKKKSSKRPEIIDAEYEIIDDGKS